MGVSRYECTDAYFLGRKFNKIRLIKIRRTKKRENSSYNICNPILISNKNNIKSK